MAAICSEERGPVRSNRPGSLWAIALGLCEFDDSPSDDVVGLDDLGFPRVDTDGGQDGNENAPERVEVLLRVEQVGDPKSRPVAVASVMKPTARRAVAGSLETLQNF